MVKTIKVHNTMKLPVAKYLDFLDFQGDLKNDITQDAINKMCNSLIRHGVFVPKFVWKDTDGCLNILDGHQTKKALLKLESDGYKIPLIPYVLIDAKDKQDAAEKLLQINSRYASINQNNLWIDSFEFPDIDELIKSVEIPELNKIADLIDMGIISNFSDEQDQDINNEKVISTSCPKCGFEYEIKK